MSGLQSRNPRFERLRKAAAELVQAATPGRPRAPIFEIIDEISAYNATLEFQIEELGKDVGVLAEELRRNIDLFDHEPIGRVTTTADLLVVRGNLAAADLLGRTKKRLDGTYLDHQITGDHLPTFHDACRRALATRAPQSVEIQVRGASNDDRWLTAAIQAMSSPADARAPEKLQVAFTDISPQKRAEAEAEMHAADYKLLLREVQHRVKNDLQTAMSFLQIQAFATDNEQTRTSLAKAEARLRAMAVVYSKLYTPDSVESVDVAGIVDAVAIAARNRGSVDRVEISVRAQPCVVPPAAGVAIGLALNELLTNAIIHGAIPGRTTTIAVTLEAIEATEAARAGQRRTLHLTVEDDGRGIPDPNSQDGPKGFGLTMVRELVSHYRGAVRVEQRSGGRGTICTVAVPL